MYQTRKIDALLRLIRVYDGLAAQAGRQGQYHAHRVWVVRTARARVALADCQSRP